MFRPGDQEVGRENFLDSMFRSELMTKCRFFIPPEAAYGSIGEDLIFWLRQELKEWQSPSVTVIVCLEL